MHDSPGCGVVIGFHTMHRAPIVTHHDVIVLPLMFIDKLFLGGMFNQFIQQPPPVCFRHTFDSNHRMRWNEEKYSLGNRMNPYQGMSNLRHWCEVTLFRNFGKLGRQTEDVIMIVYDPQILDFTFL